MKERVKTQIYIKDGKHYIRLKNTGCEEKEYEISLKNIRSARVETKNMIKKLLRSLEE